MNKLVQLAHTQTLILSVSIRCGHACICLLVSIGVCIKTIELDWLFMAVHHNH